MTEVTKCYNRTGSPGVQCIDLLIRNTARMSKEFTSKVDSEIVRSSFSSSAEWWREINVHAVRGNVP